MTEQFVFPYGDWAEAAEVELRDRGYVTTLWRRDEQAWVLDVTGSCELMLALKQSVGDDADSSSSAAQRAWADWANDSTAATPDEQLALERLRTLGALALVVEAAARRERATARLEAAIHVDR